MSLAFINASPKQAAWLKTTQRVVAWLLLASLTACTSVPLTTSQQTEQPQSTTPATPTPKRPLKLGLALGGGAARGFAHVGVLQVLEEAGIKPDLVVGTSAGSFVAALYASGKTAAQLQTVAETMEEAALTDWTVPLLGRGMMRGDALARYVNNQVAGRRIEDFKMPLGIVATDLNSGQGVLFQRGDVATAVRASSAVPSVFEPVKIGTREFVDGGLVSPVPVRYARKWAQTMCWPSIFPARPRATKPATCSKFCCKPSPS